MPAELQTFNADDWPCHWPPARPDEDEASAEIRARYGAMQWAHARRRWLAEHEAG